MHGMLEPVSLTCTLMTPLEGAGVAGSTHTLPKGHRVHQGSDPFLGKE